MQAKVKGMKERKRKGGRVGEGERMNPGIQITMSAQRMETVGRSLSWFSLGLARSSEICSSWAVLVSWGSSGEPPPLSPLPAQRRQELQEDQTHGLDPNPAPPLYLAPLEVFSDSWPIPISPSSSPVAFTIQYLIFQSLFGLELFQDHSVQPCLSFPTSCSSPGSSTLTNF